MSLLNLFSAIVNAILNDCRVGSKFALFLPAISKAVPWAGVVIGNGKPPWKVTPLSKPKALRPDCRASWYIPTIQSWFLFLNAVINEVSQGKGPSALIPCFFASFIAGIISFFSSSPNSAWGFKALNPHAEFGDEEKNEIIPAINEAKKQGINADGPLPCDTSFITAFKNKNHDCIVGMYHDALQSGLKAFGFDRGVTFQGGLPLPITTPAHGTAFDIAGKNKANLEPTLQSFKIALTMAENKFNNDKN